MGPEDLEEPFLKFCGGDWGRFEASLSRRIVLSTVRLRLAIRREGRPALERVAGPSSASSLSEALCLRFPVVLCSDGSREVVAGRRGADLAGGE